MDNLTKRSSRIDMDIFFEKKKKKKIKSKKNEGVNIGALYSDVS